VRTFLRGAGARAGLPPDWNWYFCSQPMKASRELYTAAGEVASRLGGGK
jgi:hypothetical protein